MGKRHMYKAADDNKVTLNPVSNLQGTAAMVYTETHSISQNAAVYRFLCISK